MNPPGKTLKIDVMDADLTRWLIVLRHAKSAWPDVEDHERPLAPRGLRDAPKAGHWLRESGHIPDQVVYSRKSRTRVMATGGAA